MVLGAVFFSIFQDQGGAALGGMSGVYLPLLLASTGIVTSIIGTLFVRVKEGGDPQKALNIGEFGSAILMTVIFYFLIMWLLPANWSYNDPLYGRSIEYTAFGVYLATIVGLFAGLGIGFITEYYTGFGKKPVLRIEIGRASCRERVSGSVLTRGPESIDDPEVGRPL